MSDKVHSSPHIHNLINDTKVKVRIEKKDSKGKFKLFKEVNSDRTGSGLKNIALTDMRFVLKCKDKVYFRIVEGVHTSGDKSHLDGQMGHPGGGTS